VLVGKVSITSSKLTHELQKSGWMLLQKSQILPKSQTVAVNSTCSAKCESGIIRDFADMVCSQRVLVHSGYKL
jgi:hypothetical protein